ncbi:MAG TPA: hemolysin family protein [Chlamydiales bacterium]|nr:hemolysin family protein [Chlamydiales bacterium]
MSGTYLFFTLLSIAVQGLFAFFEMACVSFNKVRLQYYVSIRTRRALWLNYLLKSPSRLFGTTLIGITTSLVIGSECARRFYESIHLNPDWSPLTQIPLVVIFGEIAPMFAARRHPEQSAMFCVPLMIVLARLLTPITWAFDAISRLIHRAMGKKKEAPLFLSREEVRMAFEESEEGEDEFNAAVSQIFQLKNLTAGQLMIPLAEVRMVPSQSTLAEVRHLLSVQYVPMIPIYHRTPHNIVAIAQLRDLICLEESKKIIDLARSPWFVTRDISILQLLQQFRRNNQNVAVILDSSGQACGLLTLDQILAEIFGEEIGPSLTMEEPQNYIERTLSGEMSVSEFNKQFGAELPEGKGDTLSDLLVDALGHLPVKDESIRLGEFEFTVDEPTLRGVKTFSVRTSN